MNRRRSRRVSPRFAASSMRVCRQTATPSPGSVPDTTASANGVSSISFWWARAGRAAKSAGDGRVWARVVVGAAVFDMVTTSSAGVMITLARPALGDITRFV